MTTHSTTRPRPGYRDHQIVGTAAQIGNVLANHARHGTLIAATAPRAATTNPNDARVRIRVRLRTTPTETTRPARPRFTGRTRRIVAVTTAVTAAVAGVLAAAAYLLGALVEFLTAHATQIGAGLIVLALAALLGVRTTRRHCPGC